MPTGKTREKAEHYLAEHVKKALSTAETAPKQKHVRACIVYTWDYQSSQSFWSYLRMQPVLTDQVVCYKALIAIHKLLVGGPHIVLGEALAQRTWFESCMRTHGSVTLGFGYGPLIQAYCEFLLAKLDFHRLHPEFTGNFDYEEYVSLKGVANLDEGYQTIEKLMELQDRVDRFQRTVFINVRPMAQNECRIASLVPLVEESYGIYKFITSMLSAMHLCVESADPLVPLVERYQGQFYALKRFYAECETLRYLTSLIEIPKLPDHPPTFDLGDGSGVGATIEFSRQKSSSSPPQPQQQQQRRESSPSSLPSTTRPSNSASADLLGDLDASDEDDERSAADASALEQVREVTHTVTTVPVVDEQAMQALREAQMQVAVLSEQLQEALHRHQLDQNLLQQYHQQFQQQQYQLSQQAMPNPELEAELTSQRESYARLEKNMAGIKDEVREWREKYEAMAREAAKWKAKFEGMAGLYQQLRAEHLEVLSQLRDLQEATTKTESSKDTSDVVSLSEMTQTLGDQLAGELLRVSQAIEVAAQRLEAMRQDPALQKLSAMNSGVHATIFDGAAAMTSAIGNLIRYAIRTQEEIVAAGKGSGTPDAFYRRNSEWTNGLISAAQAVASATMTLVETADGVLRGTRQLHHLVAASNAVAAATMQLVTASRVKAPTGSEGQPLLERAAKAVADANRHLVNSATSATITDDNQGGGTIDLPQDGFSLKVEELERQARVLALEKELSLARNDLATLRRAAYSKDGPGTGIVSPKPSSEISNPDISPPQSPLSLN